MSVDETEDLELFDSGAITYLSEGPWRRLPMPVAPEVMMAPTRPEAMRADQYEAQWGDVETWGVWLQDTYQIGALLPPCWPAHPALAEEVLALWHAWHQAWLGSPSGSAPAEWLHLLDSALSRIERRWKVPCRKDDHRMVPSAAVGINGDAGRHPPMRWWSNSEYQS